MPPAAAQQRADDGGPEALASEFSAFVNEQGIPELLRDRRPTHLMSPPACIAAQLAALQVGVCSAPVGRPLQGLQILQHTRWQAVFGLR